MPRELVAQGALRAHQRHADAELAAGEHGALHHHRGTVVAAEGVHDHAGLRHS